MVAANLLLLFLAFFGFYRAFAAFNNSYWHYEYCVFIISDEKYMADWITSKIAQDNAIVTFNSSEFLQNRVNMPVYKLCLPSAYIIVLETQSNVDSVIGYIFGFRTHSRIIGVRHNDLNVTELAIECYIRFMNYTDVYLSNDIEVWNIPQLDIRNVTRYFREDKYVHNFDRKPLKVLWFEYLPYIYEANGSIRGIEINILRFLARDLTLIFEKRTKRSWTDVANDMSQSLADLSVTGHWISRVLSQNADVTVHYANAFLTFLIPRPKMFARNLTVFRTLNWRVWLMVIATVIIYSGALHFAQWCSNKITPKFQPKNDFFILSVISLFVSSPIKIRSRYKLVKCMLLGWALSAIIFSTMYSAGYSAMSTVPSQDSKLETLEDIAKSDLNCYSPESYAKRVMAQSSAKVIRMVSERIVQSDNIVPGSCQEVVVLQGSVLVPSYLTNLNYEKFMLFREVIHSTFNTIALPRNSPYKALFNYRIFQLVEHGYINRWIQEEKMRFIPAQQYVGKLFLPKVFKRIKFENVAGGFVLLLMGCCASGVCFILEIVWKVIRKKFRKSY